MYLTGWTDIVLISDRIPDFIYNKITHILASDNSTKDWNIVKKLLIACDNEYVTEDFLYFNDDHFLKKPLNVSEIKNWHNGPLQNRIGKVYNRELQKTQNTLAEIPGALNFDIHVPIVINKRKWKSIFETRESEKKPLEICTKTFYAMKSGMEGEFMEDMKIKGHYNKADFDKVNGRIFFSTGEPFCPPTVNYLESLFPVPSRFEA